MPRTSSPQAGILVSRPPSKPGRLTGQASPSQLAKNIDKFERYDHMISGWCMLKDRYAKHCTTPPLVVFVCRDQANAKEFCRAADPLVTAGHAYGGEYPSEWDYPARERMVFVAERDVHEGRIGWIHAAVVVATDPGDRGKRRSHGSGVPTKTRSHFQDLPRRGQIRSRSGQLTTGAFVARTAADVRGLWSHRYAVSEAAWNQTSPGPARQPCDRC
jgi:hypothetical protein